MGAFHQIGGEWLILLGEQMNLYSKKRAGGASHFSYEQVC